MEKLSIKAKVDRLEEALISLAESQKRLHEELLEFKEEMKEFKQEMKEFKDEMRKQREEDRRKFEEFKEEMRAFKGEMNKKWRWLINKLGTLVEDLFYPSFDIAIKKHFGVDLVDISPRRRKKTRYGGIEIDVLGIGDGKVFVLEVKSNADNEEYIRNFKKKIDDFFKYFPEYEGYEIVPIYGSWSMSEDTVKKLSEMGIYAMVVRGDILEIVNMDDVKKAQS